MKNRIKKIMVFLLYMALLLPQMVCAGSIPSKYAPYTVDGRVDYYLLHKNYFHKNDESLTAPISAFTVTVKRNGEIVGAGNGDSGNILYTQIGDTITIQDASTAGSGTSISKCDFQVSNGSSIIKTSSTIRGMESYNIPTNQVGTYNIYLTVMDNDDINNNLENTEGWGNWSYNGSHRTPGINPGGGTGKDFPGWWYYSALTVVVKPPTYNLQEKHIDTASGTVLDETQYSDITNSTLTTSIKNFDGYEFAGSRAGYTWNEIANGTTENITSRTAHFDSTHINAFHYYYYNKIAPPPPPVIGKANIIVYYKNKQTGESVYPEDITMMGIEYGTYTINALPAPDGFTFDNTATPSPQTITVSATVNYKEVTFYYIPSGGGTSTPGDNPPIAIITAPSEKMAGEAFTISGLESYDPDGDPIVKYEWAFSGPGNVIVVSGINSDGIGSKGRVWCDEAGIYTLELTVTSQSSITGLPQKKTTICQIFN